jgi:diguanylate cyclase (GGDEF)-like protein
MMARLFTFADRTDRRVILATAFALLVMISLLDLMAGEEIALAVVYLIPVALVGWRFDIRVAGAFALLSAIFASFVSQLIGVQYSSLAIAVWNGFSQFLVFLAFSGLLGHVRSSLLQARELAMTDHLTGVANSRYFADLAQRELEHCRRHHRPFTLAYIDIDDFKNINDAFGHSGGDRVIQAVARALSSSVRRVDQVARQGGDEFMLFLHEVDGDRAGTVLEQIHTRVLTALEREGVKVSLSIGGVTWRTAPATLDAAIQSADRMMYEVKRVNKGSVMHRMIGSPVIQPAVEPMQTPRGAQAPDRPYPGV